MNYYKLETKYYYEEYWVTDYFKLNINIDDFYKLIELFPSDLDGNKCRYNIIQLTTSDVFIFNNLNLFFTNWIDAYFCGIDLENIIENLTEEINKELFNNDIHHDSIIFGPTLQDTKNSILIKNIIE